jgi:DNA-binding NarL/FixJ family response regulator
VSLLVPQTFQEDYGELIFVFLNQGGLQVGKPKILLADVHPAIRITLQNLLDGLGEVVATVTDGQALIEAAERLKPDIIFSDISIPKLNGLEATRILQRSVPQSKVIILTAYQEPAYVTLAFDAGARGYLLKRISLVAELPQALLHVLAGDRYIGLGVRGERLPAERDEALMSFLQSSG